MPSPPSSTATSPEAAKRSGGELWHTEIALWAAWMAQGMAAHAYLWHRFPAAVTNAWAHALLVAALVSAWALVARGLGAAVRRGGVPRRLASGSVALGLGLTNALLLVVYVGAIAGQHLWNGPLTLGMLAAYAGQPAHIGDITGVSAGTILAAMLALVALLTLAHAWAARRLVTARRTRRGLAARVVGIALLAIAAVLPGPARTWLRRDLVAAWALGASVVGSTPVTLAYDGPDPALGAYLAAIAPPASADSAWQDSTRPDSTRPSPLARRPIVVVIADALRADQMSVYGQGMYAAPRETTPFLDSLWRAGGLDRFDARSVCTTSHCGILGILGSRHWAEMTRRPTTAGEVLRGLGYATHHVLSGDHTHFYDLRALTAPGATSYTDGTTLGGANVNDDRAAVARLATLDLASDTTFVYLHLMSAHQIADRLPAFARWQPSDASPYRAGHRDRTALVNRYHNGVRQTDAMIAAVFAELRRQGALGRALVIVTGDHGEHLGERGQYGHSRAPYDAVVGVPLLVYDPLAPPYPARTLASTTDIAPTLIRAIGASVPSFWSGAPLQTPYDRRALAVGSLSGHGVVFRARGRLFEAIRDADDRSGDDSAALYDLHADPGEARDLMRDPAYADVAAAARRWLGSPAAMR